jgi:hypothetical protein
VAAPEWTVERHLEAGSEQGRDLWRRFADLVAACGEQSLSGARPKGDELIGWIRDAYERVGCGRR